MKIKYITLTGVFTALIFVLTAFVHIPSYTGYVHIGDAFIYLAASILPLPYAMFAGAVGAMLADVVSGFAIWAPGTLIIKAVTVFFFTAAHKNIICKRNMLALIPSAVMCIGGYYLYEGLIYGNFLTPLYGMIGNLAQAAFSSVIFIAAGSALDKAHIKEHIHTMGRTS